MSVVQGRGEKEAMLEALCEVAHRTVSWLEMAYFALIACCPGAAPRDPTMAPSLGRENRLQKSVV
jgi:hypothetical protein